MTAALKSGRYVLDGDGVLHPFRRRYWVKAVAFVTVRRRSEHEQRARRVAAKAGDLPPAVVTQLSKAAQHVIARGLETCAIAGGRVLPRATKLDISGAPSGIESLVEGWRK